MFSYRAMVAAAAATLTALALTIAVTPANAAPKRIATAKATDCAACHGADKVLPARHKSVKGMKLADCLTCHEPHDEMSLAGKLPMSHTHQLAGQTCASCHGKGKPKAVEGAACTGCHDVDKLVAKTESVKPHNPHTSPHYGKDLECTNCHVAHGKSQNYCNQCHQFDFRVP